MKDAIGVIGGMGPLASQLFYKMITEHTAAECDQDHVPLLILSDVTMPDRTGAILDGKYDNERIVVIEADKITGDHLGREIYQAVQDKLVVNVTGVYSGGIRTAEQFREKMLETGALEKVMVGAYVKLHIPGDV